MKQVYATWKGYEVQVHNLSHLPGRAIVTTADGSQPFSKYYAGAGCGMEAQGLVFVDQLENVRVVDDAVEADPFEPCDPPAMDPEYDPALEWDMMTDQLRRGDG